MAMTWISFSSYRYTSENWNLRSTTRRVVCLYLGQDSQPQARLPRVPRRREPLCRSARPVECRWPRSSRLRAGTPQALQGDTGPFSPPDEPASLRVNILSRDEFDRARFDFGHSALDLAVPGCVCIGVGFAVQRVEQFFREANAVLG